MIRDVLGGCAHSAAVCSCQAAQRACEDEVLIRWVLLGAWSRGLHAIVS